MENNALIWLGTHSSAVEYFEQLDRGYRLEVSHPEVVKEYSSREYSEDSRFHGYDDMIQVVNNVAIVPISGSMRSKESWMTRMFGIMTYDTLSNIMASLVEDGGIDTVVLDIDSPGGQAKGLDTAVDGIESAKEAGLKVVAHTAGSMSSAAYWIGSAAETVGATESAEVGSVGVIAVHSEESEANKKEGITYTVLRKGENKALATPFEKLSEKGRAQIEASMDRSYQQFVGAVSENRGIPKDYVLEKIATGDVFGAQQALELGMIDEVVTYNDLVSRYVQTDSPAQHGANNTWSEAAMHKQPIINAGELSPEEAAMAVAAGADPKDVLPNVVAEEDSTDEAAEVTVVDDDDTAATEESAEEEKTDLPDGDEPAAKAEASAMQSMISSLNEQLVEAKIEAKTLSAKVQELEAGNVGLRGIAVEQTQRLRVSLGMTDDISDLELMSDAALVTAHRNNLKQFMERFAVGAVSRVSDKDNTPPENVTRLRTAAQHATRIK